MKDTSTTTQHTPFQTEFYLSRSSYPLGSSILGTVHIRPESSTVKNVATTKHPTSTTQPGDSGHLDNVHVGNFSETNRNDFSTEQPDTYQDIKIKSIQLYVAGRCRIDPRWHDVPTITSIYGKHPCHDTLPSHYDVERAVVDSYFGYTVAPSLNPVITKSNSTHDLSGSTSKVSTTKPATIASSSSSSLSKKQSISVPYICFWSTNVLNLYNRDDSGHSEVTQVLDKDSRSSLTTHLDKDGWYQRTNRYLHEHEECTSTEQSNTSNWNEMNDLEYDDSSDEEDGAAVSLLQHTSDTHTGASLSSATSASDVQSNPNSDEETNATSLERSSNVNGDQQMNFTFRVDLPDDLPPTANTACARYFYSAVLVIETSDGKCMIHQSPFTVTFSHDRIPTDANKSQLISRAKIRIGTLYAFAHPNTPQPIHLSPTLAQDPKWDISVERMDRTSGLLNARTLPLQQGGHSFGSLTIVGGSLMRPGSKILLQFDFDDVDDLSNDVDASYQIGSSNRVKVACHQVCASLQGEEHAIIPSVGNVKQSQEAKRRTRYNVFDTAHEVVHPGYTTKLSMSLALPMDCPITLETDLVQVCIKCRVDITIRVPERLIGGPLDDTSNDEDDGNGDDGRFQVLTVEFPCRVVHSSTEGNSQQIQDCDDAFSNDLEDRLLSLTKESTMTQDELDSSHKILTTDVLSDLQMLSFQSMNLKNRSQ